MPPAAKQGAPTLSKQKKMPQITCQLGSSSAGTSGLYFNRKFSAEAERTRCLTEALSSCAPSQFQAAKSPLHRCKVAKKLTTVANILLIGDSNDRNALVAACAPRQTVATYHAGHGFKAPEIDYDRIFRQEPFFECAERAGRSVHDCRACTQDGIFWANLFLTGLPLHNADKAAPAACTGTLSVEAAVRAFMREAARRGGPTLIVGQSLLWDVSNWAGCQPSPTAGALLAPQLPVLWSRAAARLMGVLRNASRGGALVAWRTTFFEGLSTLRFPKIEREQCVDRFVSLGWTKRRCYQFCQLPETSAVVDDLNSRARSLAHAMGVPIFDVAALAPSGSTVGLAWNNGSAPLCCENHHLNWPALQAYVASLKSALHCHHAMAPPPER